MKASIPFHAISESTDGFSPIRVLGKGSFATVFLADFRKVTENSTNEQLIRQLSALPGLVAVKVLKRRLKDTGNVTQEVRDTILRAELEEMEVCSKYRHCNLCCMLAWSSDGPSRALLYEYCSGGSLYDRLTNKTTDVDGVLMPPLTWRHRLRLAAGSARAVRYLHCSPTPVVHRDIKSANILIGPRGEAKLADFGTVRQEKQLLEETHQSTRMLVGTRAYMAPEYMQQGHISVKSDAFALAIVWLELLTALRPAQHQLSYMIATALMNDKQTTPRNGNREPKGHGQNPDFGDRSFADLLDTTAGNWEVTSASRLARVALRCSRQYAAERATVAEVLPELETLAELESESTSAAVAADYRPPSLADEWKQTHTQENESRQEKVGQRCNSSDKHGDGRYLPADSTSSGGVPPNVPRHALRSRTSSKGSTGGSTMLSWFLFQPSSRKVRHGTTVNNKNDQITSASSSSSNATPPLQAPLIGPPTPAVVSRPESVIRSRPNSDADALLQRTDFSSVCLEAGQGTSCNGGSCNGSSDGDVHAGAAGGQFIDGKMKGSRWLSSSGNTSTANSGVNIKRDSGRFHGSDGLVNCCSCGRRQANSTPFLDRMQRPGGGRPWWVWAMLIAVAAAAVLAVLVGVAQTSNWAPSPSPAPLKPTRTPTKKPQPSPSPAPLKPTRTPTKKPQPSPSPAPLKPTLTPTPSPVAPTPDPPGPTPRPTPEPMYVCNDQSGICKLDKEGNFDINTCRQACHPFAHHEKDGGATVLQPDQI